MADNKKYKVGITVKEPWANNISYEQLDMTLFAVENGGDGCAYVALKPNIGVRPNQDPTTWIKATQRGQSIYDYCIEYGLFVGTEEEFAQDYADAVQAAKDAAASATHVEEEVSAAEQGRVSAENARVSAESQRAAAEESRVQSEAQRSVNETGRVNAEDSRVVAENGRVVAESQRVSAESTRATNEENRRAEFGGMMRDAETAIGLVDTAMTEAENVDATVDGMIVTITDRNGVSKSVNIGFDIYRTYGSVAAMNADAANVEDGKFVMIATLDPTSTENAQLWVRNSNAATSQNPFTFLSDLDQASSAAWADWMENQKPIIEADHTTAVADHTQAVYDHTNATNDHAVAVQDHTTAGTDHTQAVSDSTRAGQDHLVAEQDHTRAEGDHTTAGTDHTTAQSDHTTAGTDHTTASSDHTIASGDHTTALSDHDIASGDHTTAGTDHTRAESDHTTASGDHTRAESDHTLAASDHTTASSDHGIASTDHTTAQGDHTQAGDDHTIASADHANATSDHTLAGNDHTRAESDHSTAATDHTNAAADHTQAGEDHAQYLLDHESIASKANVAPNPTEGNVAALDENGNPIDSGIPSEKVAKTDGFYEGMGVGTATNLKGETVSDESFVVRPSGGSKDIASGGAEIEYIKGNTVKWNQLIQNGDFSAGTTGWTVPYESSVSDNVLSVTMQSNANCVITKSINIVKDHKYFINADIKINTSTTIPQNIYLGYFYGTQTQWLGNFSPIANNWYHIKTLITSVVNNTFLNLGVVSSVILSAGDSVLFKEINIIDLTAIFGAGNEPSTVEAFESWLGANVGLRDYYPYNTGELIPVKMTGLKTNGFNQYNYNNPTSAIKAFTGEDYQITGTYTKLWESDDATVSFTAYTYGGTVTVGTAYSNGGNHYMSNKSVAAYDNAATYALGAYCTQNDTIYKSNVAIGTAEEFDSTKWDAISDIAAMVTEGILTSMDITPDSNGKFVPTKNYLHVDGGNNTTCVHLVWSGAKDGESEAYWEQIKNVPITSLTGKLNGQGNSITVFPDGMKKVGSVYDEIINEGGVTKAIKRIGSIDLGASVWGRELHGDLVQYKLSYTRIPNILCSSNGKFIQNAKFEVISGNLIGSWPNKQDIIGTYYSTGTKFVSIQTNRYNDIGAFMTAMSGVPLYYELDTPEIYILDDFELPMGYKVDDYGTEEILTPTPVSDELTSCAPTLGIRYGLNAADTIRNLPNNYVSATEQQDFSSSEKAMARQNIGAMTEMSVDNVKELGSNNLIISGEAFQEARIEVSGATATRPIFTIKPDQTVWIYILYYGCNIKFRSTSGSDAVNLGAFKANELREYTNTTGQELHYLRHENATAGGAIIVTSLDISALSLGWLKSLYPSMFGVPAEEVTDAVMNRRFYNKDIEVTRTVPNNFGNKETINKIFSKGDIVQIEVSVNVENITGRFYFGYYDESDTFHLLDNPTLALLVGKVYVFKAPANARNLGWYIQSGSTFPFNIGISCKVIKNENNVLGYVKTNKEVLFPVRRDLIYFQEENELYIRYNNLSNSYGGLHRVRYQYSNGTVNIDSIYGRAGYSGVRLVNSYISGEYGHIIITNPNNIKMELEFYDKATYNIKYPRIPYAIQTLGNGRNVISPLTSRYCHDSFINIGEGFSYITYHSNQIRTTENTNDYQNSVYLSILEDGKSEAKTQNIFSDHDYVETYNSNELLCPYNHSNIEVANNNILIRCGFRNGNDHIWMYKLFNMDTWELSAIAPQKLSYNGSVVDWTQKNYIDMINTLYGFSFDDTFVPRTNEILRMFKYNDTYYILNTDIVQEGNVDTVTAPFILLSSPDAITWTPVAKLLDGQLASEQAIAIHDNKLFVIFRPGHNSLKYAVFSMTDYSIVKAVTNISNGVSSMPTAFVYNGKIYTMYNASPSGVMPISNYYSRTCISLSYLNESNELVELKKYYSAAGFQYFDIAIRGNIIRFSNTEDNGGYNISSGGPYCQCSVCDIKNEDLVIPSN